MSSIGDVIQVGSNLMELIEFQIDKGDRFDNTKECFYGINVFKVREVIKMPEIIPLPDKLPYIEGMFNLRNENIPLLNLVDRLGGKNRHFEENSVIVAEFSNIFIGLMVHKVIQIHRISWDKISPPPKVTSGKEAGLVIGVVQLRDNDSLIILDFEKIVSDINPVMQEEISSYDANDYELGNLFNGLPIILADDSKLVRNQMKNFLTKLGFIPTIFENGQQTLNHLLKLKKESEENNTNLRELVTFVITDIEMPVMDGYTLTSKIKEDSVLKNIPVLMHTSLSGDNVRIKGSEVGADAYITKFSSAGISKALKECFEKFPI